MTAILSEENALADSLEPRSFSDLEGWDRDQHLAAFQTFLVSARRMLATPYKVRALPIDGEALRLACQAALDQPATSNAMARRFFQSWFRPCAIVSGPDLLTGYFEPELMASRHRTDTFSVPLYRRPPDLVALDGTNRPDHLPADMRFARAGADRIEPYHDREAIMAGALANLGLELCWLASPVDAFFVHVQGSARLRMTDGSTMRITYAAKSGHPYTSLGQRLAEQLAIPATQMTADRLRSWMTDNPDDLDALLKQNRSYIFFEEVSGLDDGDGPLAAAKVPLTPGRSLAVDRNLHTFSVPLFISTSEPLPGETRPLARLMVAQDTGSAIQGAARGDFFAGTGTEAGLVAGRIRHSASFSLLLPRSGP